MTQMIPDHVEPALGAGWRVSGPGPLGAFLTEAVNDRLLQVSMELAAELWVTRRRLAAIEAQLVERGTVISPDRLPSELEPEQRRERDAFVQRIFGCFTER